MNWISFYFLAYTFFVVFYLWFMFFGIFISTKQRYSIIDKPVSIIIPTFNENKKIIKQVIKSAVKNPINQVIVVDDGGTKENYNHLKQLKKEYNFTLIRLPKNKGKRHAQYEGFKLAKYEYIITLDSDTTINKRSILEILKPFNDSKIGAITGNVLAKNPDKNWLTKCINSRYWSAFNFERMSQSTFGTVSCCCGSFSVYRTSLIRQIMNDYKNQKFLGVNCNFGDDRHLTMLILKNNYKVVMAQKAIAYTYVPETLKSFIRQQCRWSQSFIRENLLAFKFMFRNWHLGIYILLTSLMPILSLGVRLSMVYFIIILPISVLFFLGTIMVMSVTRNIFQILETKKYKYIIYNIIYGFLHTFIIYWLFYIALWKTFINRERSWGTR